MLAAFQSVIMLMVLTRALGLQEAGIFTIAYANANLFLTIGKYGMRNFQVSDVNEQFTFNDYLSSRIVTLTAMVSVSVAYVLYAGYANSYTADKSMTIIWMCLLKAVDAIEDVYHGLYQQKNRLDIAGKALTLRMFITILLFAFCVIFSKSLLASVIVSTIASFAVFIIFTFWTFGAFDVSDVRIKLDNAVSILKSSFPLFVSAFLSMYIGSAPKYAIDANLNDELQACYGFIAMPVFIIGVLNGFIFNPVLYKMSVFWNERDIKRFVRRVLTQMCIIFMITDACIAGAYVCGIPVLSWLYNTELSSYRSELLVLLAGGGFFALAGFFNIVLTIMRCQKSLMVGYAVVALAACLLSDGIVAKYGISGAAMLYAALMAVLCIVFGEVILKNIISAQKNFT